MMEKMRLVNSPEYIENKQLLLDQVAEQNGTVPQKAKIDEFEFL